MKLVSTLLLLAVTACGGGRASPTSKGAALVTTPCVLHAGDARGSRGPDGKEHASCSFNAECVAEPGETRPGDGFVTVACEDLECQCEWSAAGSGKTDHETFTLDALPRESATCRTLLLERCMKGMQLHDADAGF